MNTILSQNSKSGTGGQAGRQTDRHRYFLSCCATKNTFKPKKQKHFNRGCKRGNALLTQLRVGRSYLNSHGYSINLADSDQCNCSRTETVTHFFNQCFLYQQERQQLVEKIEKLIPKFSKLSDKRKTEILLFGINLNSDEPDSRNVPITLAAQTYILQTKRFNYPST